MFEEGLVGLVLSDATVQSLIGNRLYAIYLPENVTFPAATYQVVSGSTPNRSFENKVQRMKRVQFDFWMDQTGTLLQTKCVEAAVSNVLDGFTGTLSDSSRILICERSVTNDTFNDQSRFYRVMNEYEITYVE